ncbi:MAG TPA: hypothetical protein VFM14_10110 [Gemmatimonadales bacterium]|nr:hypothetical protein [Gemmatimonadales bacterium]
MVGKKWRTPGVGHQRRAEILATLGRREEAAREYARFIKLWKEADPELQPAVREAKAALARLGITE